MENRTRKIIELENDEEYLILRQILYKNETYYVTTQVLNNGSDFAKEITLLKESNENNDIYVTVVDDPNILKTILNHVEF